jgi:hypothetical protein
MKSWAKWTAKTVLVTTGFAAAGGGFAGVAFAGTASTNAVNLSVLGGNQINVPVTISADICGNARALLGIAIAGCQGGVEVVAHHGTAVAKGRAAAPAKGHAAAPAEGRAAAPARGRAAPARGRATRSDGGRRARAADPSGLLSSTRLAGLGTLPRLANLSTLTSDVNSGEMSGDSMATLAVGALLAGAAALKIAGRRSTDREPRAEEVSA